LPRFKEILERAFQASPDWRGEYPLTKRGYFIGLGTIFAAAYSQYVVKAFGPILEMLIIYGIPIWVVSFLCGSAILRRTFHHTPQALKFGLGLFGIFALLGLLAASGIFSIIVTIDPHAQSLLQKPNPVLHVPPEFAWIMVWLSLLVVGPAEEYLFRGFVYGGLLSLFRNRHWLILAFFSALLFPAAHLYYALVYGIASLALFAELLAIGTAFAATYYLSGGNLFIPVVLHGLYDASGFLTVALSPTIGLALRFAMMGTGILVGLVLLLRGFSSPSSALPDPKKTGSGKP
jgi:membrane protease YdiL (CAAX protease family)